MLKFEQLIALYVIQCAEADKASEELKPFPRGPMGLTPDEVKFSPEYRSVKKRFNGYNEAAKQTMKALNKHYKKEFRAWSIEQRDARRAARLAAAS